MNEVYAQKEKMPKFTLIEKIFKHHNKNEMDNQTTFILNTHERCDEENYKLTINTCYGIFNYFSTIKVVVIIGFIAIISFGVSLISTIKGNFRYSILELV